MLGGLGLYTAALSYGFWRGRTWTRPLLLLLVVGFVCYGIWDMLRTRDMEKALILAVGDLVFVGGTYWYLYRKRNVAAYYAELMRR